MESGTKAAPESRDRYEWLSETATAELTARLNAAGPRASLERRESAHGSCYRVYDPDTGKDAAAQPDINDSVWCPPLCRNRNGAKA